MAQPSSSAYEQLRDKLCTHPMAVLSAYEQLRDKKIAENRAKLEELGLGDTASSLKAPKRPRPKKKKRRDDAPPPRRSSRLKREPAPDIRVEDERPDGTVEVGGAAADALRAPDVDALPVDADDLTGEERPAYEALRAARNAKARSMERSMFIVANDRTLAEMVRRLPRSVDDLASCYGMGAKKLAAHGAMLLAALEPHRARLAAHHRDLRAAKAAA